MARDGEPECLGRPQEAASREIEEVAGRLVEFMDSPEWAGGASLALARGEELQALVNRARTVEQLKQIAKARGYKRGWIKHVLASRYQRHAAE